MKNKPTHSLISNIIFLFGLQWKHAKLSFVFLFLLIPITLGLSFCSVYLPSLAVDLVASNADATTIVFSLALVGIVITILEISSQTINTYNFALMTKFRTDVKLLNTKKILHTDYENLESPKCRILMDRADEALWGTGKGSTVEQMLRGATALLTNMLGYIIFGTILFFFNPSIAIILTILPIFNFILIKAIQKYQYINKHETGKLDRKLWYIATAPGNFEASKDIRLYGMNQWFVHMYKKISNERLGWDKKFAKKYFMSDILNASIILFRDGLAYIILIKMFLNNEIDIAGFVLCFGIIGGFANWVGGIFNTFIQINSISLIICDLRDFLKYPNKNNTETGTSKADKNDQYSISIDNLCYKYENSDEYTLKNINIEINSGEKIAIVGHNGAGKTTLIKILCGLYRPTSGKITVNGKFIDDFNIYDYYSLFSTVFQDDHFLPISISKTIACANDEDIDKVKVAECIKNSGLENKINALKYKADTLLNKQLHEEGIDLSGGEKQKLLLARAIYRDAPILILDEPTSALDPIAESELYTKYSELTKNKTSFFISHRLASTRFCDRILFMENGEIVEVGTHDELIKLNGKYAEVYQVQSQYYK